jgi:hypothetical protein
VRSRGRARGIAFLPGLALWALAAFAQAQSFECPPGASCHPNGAGLGGGVSDAADAVGNELNRRRREGDCTGLGPDGCMGLLLSQLMCLVDDRDWVQQLACMDPPPPISGGAPGDAPGGGAGGGAGGDAGGGDAGGDAGGGDAGAPAPGGDAPGPGGDAPAPEPDPEATIFVTHPELNRWLRANALRSGRETPLLTVKYGDRGGVDFHVAGLFEWRVTDPSEYFVVLRAVDLTTRRHINVVVGGAGRSVYATPHAWLANLKLGTGTVTQPLLIGSGR